MGLSSRTGFIVKALNTLPTSTRKLLIPTIVLLCLRALYLARKRRRLLPPGPPGVPIIGNLLDWPTSNETLAFKRWKGLYGDLIYANVCGQHLIVVSNYDSARRLLSHKGAKHSDRPSLYFVCELIGWGQNTTLLPEGPQLKEHRRLINQHIGTLAAAARFELEIQERTREFLCSILQKTGESRTLYSRIHGMFGAIILNTTYGYQPESEEDKFVNLIEHVMKGIASAARPGVHLVDIFPILDYLPSWFPGTGFKKEAFELRQDIINIVENTWKFTHNNLDDNSVRRSLVARNILGSHNSINEEHNLKWAAATLYAAGTETTSSAFHSFFLMMLLYPDIQSKAQAEIDEITGGQRLPTIADRPQLPYLNAVITEVLRYCSIAPLGMPHVACEDDVFDGYLIPKGTIIMTNLKDMQRDPRYYESPDIFDPSRFLKSNPELDPSSFVFGFGRRICPGRFMVEAALFVACANLLATMRISPELDDQGNQIIPLVEFTEALISQQVPFPCKINVRSAGADALLREVSNA